MPSPTPASTARDILRQARRRQRLSQAQLAARAGVSKTVVARYESGQQPTIAALERLVAACGYEIEWTLRSPGTASGESVSGESASGESASGESASGGSASAVAGGARGTVSEAPAGGPTFHGPIGRRLSVHLAELLDILDAAGASGPRLYGDVADGCEGAGSWVVIGVTVPADANPMAVIAASGRIGLLLGADVRVVPHDRVADYGWDGDGVPLTGEESPPIRRCG
ncbi:hypothetical protein GCM10022415_09810 [Knoellia locipacati]|uniref:HTH cro/C1-type domain-containing protein n=1 Tax=Knoellia locipacati TaxID=882824 RepID=A0A512SYB5_9MICO|nr:helix-turn-helix transcriptional regulator [Knoellia locipacati]GEQ12932.1 hypothetical protein KLO01_09790 [Knoellia locipacati]